MDGGGREPRRRKMQRSPACLPSPNLALGPTVQHLDKAHNTFGPCFLQTHAHGITETLPRDARARPGLPRSLAGPCEEVRQGGPRDGSPVAGGSNRRR
jgi:hypothetical protein